MSFDKNYDKEQEVRFMQPKMVGKIIVDLGMTILLMLLMAFELIGRTAHEWIGAGMFVLFIVHHILNRKWSGNLFHGKYSSYRSLQTVSAVLVFFCDAGFHGQRSLDFP